MSETPISRKVVAYGRVQGVFFRDSVRREARRLGVAGYALNRIDGSVVAVFEGPSDAVMAMVDFCRAGPGHSVVEYLDVDSQPPEGLRSFDVR